MGDDLKREVLGAFMYDHGYLTMTEKEELSEAIRTNDSFAAWIPPSIDPDTFHDAIQKYWHTWRGQLKLRVKGALMKDEAWKKLTESDKAHLLDNYRFIYQDPVNLTGVFVTNNRYVPRCSANFYLEMHMV